MDLDLRLVRAFVAVADEGHFGRAARHLHVAQPAVSRQVRRLEAQLGTRLLDRTSRSVAVTAAGSAFLPDARVLLAAADAALRRLRQERVLTVGFLPGIVPTPAVRAFRRQHPDMPVDVRRLEGSDQAAALRERRVDVCLGRLPMDREGLCVEALYDEPRVALLAADHRLASAPRVHLAELAGEPMVRHADLPSVSDAYWAMDPRLDGSRVVWGPVVTGLEEKLEQVAAGQAVTILPRSMAMTYTRDDVCVVPLADAPPSTVVLAWTDDHRLAPLRASFLEMARGTLTPS